MITFSDETELKKFIRETRASHKKLKGKLKALYTRHRLLKNKQESEGISFQSELQRLWKMIMALKAHVKNIAQDLVLAKKQLRSF